MTRDPTRRRRAIAAVVAAVVGAAALGACGDDTPDDATPSTGSATPATTDTAPPTPDTGTPVTTDAPSTTDTLVTTDAPATTSAPATTAPTSTERVNVYWAWTIPTSVGTPERLGAGARAVPADDPVVASMRELLAGPDDAEADAGMATAIPEGTSLLGVTVADGIALVDLDDTFTAPAGSLGEATRLAQVVFTLTAFDEVERVAFAIDGVAQEMVLSHGFVVGDGFDRDDFQEVRPFILVESPTPGERVTGDVLAVSGESNTFEANVQWELLDGAGTKVADGFTTATGGMGTWGEFEFTTDLGVLHDLDDEGAAAGDVPGVDVTGVVVVFETSPRDGTRQNVVEVPFVVE